MDKYNIPYLECPNLIKDNQGNFGLKDINLLKKCLKNYNIFDNIENKDNDILWFDKKYKNIMPLQEKIKNTEKDKILNIVKFLIQDLIKQVNYLQQESKTLVSLNLNDIIVTENNYFFFINEFKVCKFCSEPNYALCYMPVPLTDYIAPEISLKKLVLPLKFNRKCCYWSIGALAMDVLFEYKIDGEYDENNLNKIINPLRFNPLYLFLKRSLEKEIDKRVLIMF